MTRPSKKRMRVKNQARETYGPFKKKTKDVENNADENDNVEKVDIVAIDRAEIDGGEIDGGEVDAGENAGETYHGQNGDFELVEGDDKLLRDDFEEVIEESAVAFDNLQEDHALVQDWSFMRRTASSCVTRKPKGSSDRNKRRLRVAAKANDKLAQNCHKVSEFL